MGGNEATGRDEPITGGVALVRALHQQGVELVFGIPGTHNLEIYRGLSRYSIAHVVTRHEQGAAYAADGYARASGRPGVVVTTTGPGLTNALTGMANAYADSVPMLVISPGPPLGEQRRGTGRLHEMKDQRAVADNAVARSIRPATTQQAVEAIHETFARWHAERPRPVHLEVPHDVLTGTTAGDAVEPRARPFRSAPSAAAVDAVLFAIDASERIAIVAGGGSIDNPGPLARLAELIGAPVLTTTTGKGAVDESHPLAVGPHAESAGAREWLRSADLVIALGTELRATASFAGSGSTIVRVDVDAEQLHKNVPADLPVLSDAGCFIDAVLSRCGERSPRSPGRAEAEAATLRDGLRLETGRAPLWRELHSRLRDVLPRGSVLTGDSSQVSYEGSVPFWRVSGPRELLITTGFSTLGYALPAALGAKLARPSVPVVAVCGDGALMFSVQELMTAVELGLDLPVLVVDNGGFAEIRQNMVDAGIPPFAVELARPDFLALATAMGCRAVRTTEVAHAAQAVADSLGSDAPTLVVLDLTAATS